MMIDYYDPNIHLGIHTVRMTFMQWGYVGHIAFKIGGNTKGASPLNSDFLGTCGSDDIDDLVENDCKLTSWRNDEGDFYFTAVLTDLDGNTIEIEEDEDGLKDIIVGLEIVAFEKEA